MHPVVELLLVCFVFALGLASLVGTLLFALVKVYLMIMQRRVRKARVLITDYEERTGHRADYKLLAERALFQCRICGQAEDQLTERCPAVRSSRFL